MFAKATQRPVFGVRRQQGRAVGRHQFCPLRQQEACLILLQIACESPAQRGDKRKRASAQEHGSLYFAAVREGRDGLHGHGMENGSRNVGATHVAGYEVLHVGFREYAAAGSYRVNSRGFLCQHGQFLYGNTQEYGHLVDESARSAGAVAVHPQVAAPVFVEIYDLCVFAAYVDQRTGLGIQIPGVGRGRYHFLNKRNAKAFGKTHSDRARNGRTYPEKCCVFFG